MNDKIRGIVLSSTVYKEQDLLLRVLTNTNELYSLVLKGGNKINSKRRSQIIPFSETEFIINLVYNKNIYTINNLSLIKYNKILNDPLYYCVLAVFNEIINQGFKDYALFIETIKLINKENYKTLLAIFIVASINEAGVNPNLSSCLKCNSTKVVGFSISDGGYLCSNHLDENRLDIELLQTIRIIFRSKIEYLDLLLEKIKIDYSIIDILIEYYSYHTNSKLESYKFLKTIDN